MRGRERWAMVMHAIPTVGLMLQGLLYVVTPTFMPYHADALAVRWEELPPHYQGFLLGVLKGMGAGSIAVTLAILIMLAIPFRRGHAWARWAVPVVGITFTALTAYAAMTIALRTDASTPWRQTLGLVALYVTGALISYWPRGRRTVPSAAAAGIVTLLVPGLVCAQELEPRAYSPSPVGTTFVLGGVGRSAGGILFDESLNVDNVQADLWVVTTGFGRTFRLAGRQARVLAVFPMASGAVEGDVSHQSQRQNLTGLVDPRLKVSIGLHGAPALTLAEFTRAPRRTVVGASVTVIPPWGQYNSGQLVNLGYNRWGVKPEVGVSHPVGRVTLDGYAGVWLFTRNDSYYPGDARKRQSPVLALQGHASYALPGRTWLALDGTWFAGGETRVDGVLNPDLQRNTRVGVTLSVPIVGQQSLKFVYSTGTSTRRGSDFNTFNVTWQLVKL